MRSVPLLRCFAVLACLLPSASAQASTLPAGLAEAVGDALAASAYAPRPLATGRGFQAEHPVQGLATDFTTGGVAFAPRDRAWSFGLDLIAFGRGQDASALGPATPVQRDDRIEYRHDELVEWYVQDRRGVEQLFSIAERRPGDEPLALVLRYRGGLTPQLADGDRTALFHDANGDVVLRYAGLLVLDADGREVPARIELRPERLVLRVDDRSARYPLLVDPVVSVEEAELSALDGEVDDQFGASVAVAGDTAAVGAPMEDSMGTRTGAVYVFVRDSEGIWTQQAKLSAPTPAVDDRFGTSVGLVGDTLLVGCPQVSFPFAPPGKVVVFERSGTVWTDDAVLVPSDALSGDQFGRSLAIDGTTAVIGAPYRDDNGLQSGAAYVYTESGGVWSEEGKLVASNGMPGDQFGISVDVEGDTAAAGAWYVRGADDAPQSGAAYVYARNAGIWTEEAQLDQDDPKAFDQFGYDVAVTSDLVAVGMPGRENVFNLPDYGAVLVYERTAGVWSELIQLDPETDPVPNDDPLDPADDDDFGCEGDFTNGRFGTTVAAQGDTIVVGSAAYCGDRGRAYVYRDPDGTGLALEDAFRPLAPAGAARVGDALDIAGATVILGAVLGDGIVSDSGTAHVFIVQPTGTFIQEDPTCAFGTPASPTLTGDGPLIGGLDVTLTLTGGPPSGMASLVLGFARIDAPFAGCTFVPSPDLILPLPLDANGDLAITLSWTKLLPGDFSVYFQYWIADATAPFGWVSSNALEAVNAPDV